MFYKITNTECQVYKNLHSMRTEELQWEKENKQLVEERVGLEWDQYMGREGQQNFGRVTEYSGFMFKEPEKVDPKIWTLSKEHENLYVPNRKTKAGREMSEFLRNGLKCRWFNKIHDAIGVPQPIGKFSFPWVEIFGDVIAIYLHDGLRVSNEDIIEITRKEFEQITEAKL